MNAKIHKLLYEWGVQPHLLGFIYLKDAVKLVSEDSKHLYQITKLLYPTIAKANDTTASRVERAIRHAVTSAFNNMGADEVYEHFGRTIGLSGSVTNSMFIAALVNSYKAVEDNNG